MDKYIKIYVYFFFLVILSLIIILEDYIVMEFEIVIFYCNVIGNLILRIIWIRDGKIIVDGNILSFEINRN